MASSVAGSDAEIGRTAFDSFLAAADRISVIADMRQDTVESRGGPIYSNEAVTKGMNLQRESMTLWSD